MIPGRRRTGKVSPGGVQEKRPRPSARCVAAWWLLLVSACYAEEGRPLREVERRPVDAEAATLAVAPGGEVWLGLPGAIQRGGPAQGGGTLALPGEGVPALLGWLDERTYLRLGDRVVVVAAGEDSVRAWREGFGEAPVLVDEAGGVLLQGAGSGAVLAHDPDSLAPVWAWPALAERTTAMARSPEGDRLYQALVDADGDARILVRDFQTGRTLGTHPLPRPLEDLETGDDGTLYGVARNGRAAIVALNPRRGELEPVWRTTLPVAEEGVRVRIAVDRGRVAVWGLGPRIGLRLLDARTGEILARTRADPLDVAFAPGGALWALFPGELRRLE